MHVTTRPRTRRVFLLAALALLVPLAASAADGRIPIYQSTTISQPGSYYLTQDISGSGNVITIAAHGVTLDLDGHTITATSGDGVSASLWSHLRITNGRIAGGSAGVYVFGGSDIRVDHVTCSGQTTAGIQIQGDSGGAYGGVIESCAVRVPTSTTYSIDLENLTGASVQGSTVYGAMIYVGNCKGVTITGNAVFFSGNDGIRLASASNVDWIDRNTVCDNTGYGIVLYNSTHCSVDRNLMARNGGTTKEGLLFGSGATANVFSYNRLEGNGASGVGGAASNIDGGGNMP